MDKNISKLKNLLGENNVLCDMKSKLIYGKDLTENFTPNPLAIIFPENENHVFQILKIANEEKISLVPSGGRTGYSAGAVAMNNEVIVSFEEMNRIISFNDDDSSVKCDPGVTLKEIQNFALKKNLFYPVDFAPSDICQIGGMISTNAGGIKVLRYGSTRNWVIGLRVVTGNGDLLEFNYGLIKNACGYDLRHLFIGAEGTLGFITEATLKLTKSPSKLKVVLISIKTYKNIIIILNFFREKLEITAFEFFSDIALSCMIKESKLNHPFKSKTEYYILLEYESNDENDFFVKNFLEKFSSKNLIEDFLISENDDQAKKFWCYRIEISRALNHHFPYKYDISVLPSKIPDFIAESDLLLSKIYPDLKIVWFGHAGDGNLHLNILKPDNLHKEQFYEKCKDASNQLYSLIKKFQGAISAEHGVGLIKRDFLKYSKSQIEINYMRNIKKVFDQNNIMNPGKTFSDKNYD